MPLRTPKSKADVLDTPSPLYDMNKEVGERANEYTRLNIRAQTRVTRVTDEE